MSEAIDFPIPSFDISELPPMPPKEAMVADADTEDYVPAYEPAPPDVSMNPDSLRTVPLKRSPGRPKGSRNQPRNTPPAPILEVQFSSTEISNLMGNILRGTTGSLGKIKPYLAMTESEVENISKPLARWAVRTAPSSPRVAKAINKLDLIAAGSTVLAYTARVGYERSQETSEARQAQLTRQRAKVVDMQGNPVDSDFGPGNPNGPIVASQPMPQNASPMVSNSVPTNGQTPYVSQPAIPR